jgi:hypothetical protein
MTYRTYLTDISLCIISLLHSTVVGFQPICFVSDERNRSAFSVPTTSQHQSQSGLHGSQTGCQDNASTAGIQCHTGHAT